METNIDNLIKKLEKEFDDKIIQPLENLEPVEPISFGIKSLDKLTGIGGAPRGRITELFGTESSGKSSLCLSLIAEAQKSGLQCAYIDMEFAMTKGLAIKAGVDLAKLVYSDPSTGEEALKLIEELLENNVKLIVVDSVSSLVPEDEAESEFDEQSIGLQARMMSKAMRKLTGPVKRQNAALVFINQIRDDINKMGFGPKTTTSGGRALRFYSSLRLKLARKDWLKKGDENIGMTVIITSEKNKMAQPRLSTEVEFYFETGFDKDGDLLNYYVTAGEISLIGRTYYHKDTELGNKQKAIEYIYSNRDKFN